MRKYVTEMKNHGKENKKHTNNVKVTHKKKYGETTNETDKRKRRK